MEFLGEGNNGYAYKTDDGLVYKVSIDRREYRAAKALEGKKLKYSANIYDCWKGENLEGEIRYAIIREYLKMTSNDINEETKEQFMSFFKNSWIDCHDSIDYSKRKEQNYCVFMFKNIGGQNEKWCETAFGNFLKRTRSNTLIEMYHTTCQAIIELYQINTKVELDLNGGNIGFDMNGHMKYFDLLQWD